jgi:hypothetical protein
VKSGMYVTNCSGKDQNPFFLGTALQVSRSYSHELLCHPRPGYMVPRELLVSLIGALPHRVLHRVTQPPTQEFLESLVFASKTKPLSAAAIALVSLTRTSALVLPYTALRFGPVGVWTVYRPHHRPSCTRYRPLSVRSLAHPYAPLL